MTQRPEEQHTAFLDEITAACRQHERNVIAECNRRKTEYDQWLARELDVKEKRIQELVEENTRLKTLLSNSDLTSSPTATSPQHHTATSSGTPASPDEILPSADLKAKYLLSKKAFEILKNNHQILREGYEREKARKRDLQSELASLREQFDELRKVYGDAAGIRRDCSTQPALPPPQPSTATNIESGGEKSDGGEQPTQCSVKGEHSQPELPTLPPAKDYDDIPIKEERSSSPVIVSEKLNRKRRPIGTPSMQKRAKTESSSQANPRSLPISELPGSEDSLDLGEVGQHWTTPKKRKGQELEAHNAPILVFQQPAGITPLRQHQPSTYVKAPAQGVRPAPLTPRDPNRMANRGATKRPRRTKEDVHHGVQILAEDGCGADEEMAGQNSAVTPMPKGRLDDLLNTPAPNDHRPNIARRSAHQNQHNATPHGDRSFATTSSRKTAPAGRSVEDELMIPRPRELPWQQSARKDRQPREAPATPTSRPKKISEEVSIKSSKRPQGMLRAKPVSELRIGDFRVNPAANEGYDYAFSDVVRGKDDRAKLKGCVDPHCCGKEMRALALSDRPKPPLTEAQKREEQRFLEDYLGDHSYKLDTMDVVQREELWIKAKTQELADKFAKHRDRFRRARSPVGYWDADFPSTQDLEAEKTEAEKRVRETIEDRYREALRPGGLWLFRDE